jgi:ribosomal protein S12 methylthiotransferase
MKYYLESLGCAKNQVDSELLMARLRSAGWALSGSEDADTIIVNSCGFIESAKQESINTVLEFRKQFPAKKIILAGCLAVRYERELREALGEADLVCPSSDAGRILTMMSAEDEKYPGGGKAPLAPKRSFSATPLPGGVPAPKPPGILPGTLKPVREGERPLLSLPGSAYIKIAEGCDNRCTFCAIPLIRGPLRSRSIDSVTAEFKALLGRGIKEVCLIAQDSASFGADGPTGGLPALLTELLKTGGDYWIRLLYLHPDHFPFDILPLMQNDRRLLPYFDIPFQHASKKILQAMNRRGDKASYLALIEKIRAMLPDAVFRSTFLVGFPGETDGDFEEALDFQLKAGLDWAGAFAYSAEEGTPAAAFKKKPSKKTAAERKAKLEQAQIPITSGRLLRFPGKKLTVLLEEEIDSEAGIYLGRAWFDAPDVDGSVVIDSDTKLTPGEFTGATVTGLSGVDLRASALVVSPV